MNLVSEGPTLAFLLVNVVHDSLKNNRGRVNSRTGIMILNFKISHPRSTVTAAPGFRLDFEASAIPVLRVHALRAEFMILSRWVLDPPGTFGSNSSRVKKFWSFLRIAFSPRLPQQGRNLPTATITLEHKSHIQTNTLARVLAAQDTLKRYLYSHFVLVLLTLPYAGAPLATHRQAGQNRGYISSPNSDSSIS
ncbi:hypothetical protein B0H13DRAFT_1872523 [Mycena leptocephala]|nr:hypothetical protein B0H13DRAFT_1872523 [Mycena leptocephala]